MPALLPTFTTETLHIRPWNDEVIDRLGFDPRSPYVERFWLGILGPSTTWLLRRVAAGFDTDPDGFDLDLVDTARSIGLGDRSGRHSPFLRTVNRTVQFGMAVVSGRDELAVRRRMPPLARRQVDRLPASLQAAHQRWQDAQLDAGAAETARTRGRHAALGLIALGHDFEDTERQLLRWGHHPAVASEATTWAWAQRTRADAG